MKIRNMMAGRAWMPFKIIHPKTCEVMGLEQGSIHLAHYDTARGRIDLLDEGFKPYKSITEESAVPMHIGDPSSYSVLTKMYAVALFQKNYENSDKGQNSHFLKVFSGRLGVAVPTFKNWIKKHS